MAQKLPEEFLETNGPGRRFVTERVVRLGDVDPSNELRLDAIGRYAQDLASDDAADAGLEDALHFVLRKTIVVVDQPPVFRERLASSTFCNGVGGRWAGRQSVFAGNEGALVTLSAVWVHIDPDSGRPKKLATPFHDVYDESAQGRKASIKLFHDQTIPSDAESMQWPFRWADLDLLGHVNNAASWRPLEQLIHKHGLSRRSMVADLEYRTPTPPDTLATVWWHLDAGADMTLSVWITDEKQATTFATARLVFPVSS